MTSTQTNSCGRCSLFTLSKLEHYGYCSQAPTPLDRAQLLLDTTVCIRVTGQKFLAY